jgi:hypothetical protein
MLRRTVGYEDTRRSLLEESTWLRFSSPLFSALVKASAEDTDLVELATATRPGQPAGILLPIVAHYLLLKSPDPGLSRYFASVTPTPEPAEEAFPAFRSFCLERREEVADLLARHTVNTTFVERSSSILATLTHVSRLTREPLNLVEICCSAGLNLLFDQYHYDFGPAGQTGEPRSAVQLTCKVIGKTSPPINDIPQVASRVGVDLVKVNPEDPRERLWMQATLFPEWKVEREHLDAALSVRATHPLNILEGDALEVLPTLLPEIPGTLCLLYTHCMGQWSDRAKAELDHILREASRERDIHRVGIDRIYHEAADSVRSRLAKLHSAKISLTQKSFPSLIEHTWYSRTDARTAVLGQADGCGAWIDWQGPLI